eukprot:8802447-Pyramimonas_sp.AAC.1
MRLRAETANNAGAPAATAAAAVLVNDMWQRRMERAADRSAHWLQSPHNYMTYWRVIRPRNQRSTESPASARSGASAISERDMLHI